MFYELEFRRFKYLQGHNTYFLLQKCIKHSRLFIFLFKKIARYEFKTPKINEKRVPKR